MMAADAAALTVFELRRYVMKPGRRDDLIALFEREFIETQEACGMLPIGHYRNLDDRDEFAWFRGFSDMASRREALEAFYGNSQAWRKNRDAANDTMIDSDNVLLLRPAGRHAFDLDSLERPAGDATARGTSLVGVGVLMLRAPLGAHELGSFESGVLPELERHANRIAVLETEDAPNDFRLPVREGEWALVTTGACSDEAALLSFLHALQRDRLPAELREKIAAAEYLRLEPAARSLYR